MRTLSRPRSWVRTVGEGKLLRVYHVLFADAAAVADGSDFGFQVLLCHSVLFVTLTSVPSLRERRSHLLPEGEGWDEGCYTKGDQFGRPFVRSYLCMLYRSMGARTMLPYSVQEPS